MSFDRTGRVVFVGGAETLLGAERGLRRHGVRVDRIPAFRYVATPRERVRREVARFGPYDVLLLTSKESVHVMADAGALYRSPRPAGYRRIVTGGPATARALADEGIHGSWSPRHGVGTAVARHLGHGPPLRIVYPRSDRAGPGLARELRRQGHEVLDLVAYRVRPVAPATRQMRTRLLRADRILVTSPSALSYLRHILDPSSFRLLRRQGGLVVLGEKSARAARGHGFRGVRVAPGVSDQTVQEVLLMELSDAH